MRLTTHCHVVLRLRMCGNIPKCFLYAFVVRQERHLYLFNSKYLELHTFIWKNYSTYLLHGAVFLEKLTSLQLIKKFLTSYGTRRFITAFTSAHHLSLF